MAKPKYEITDSGEGVNGTKYGVDSAKMSSTDSVYDQLSMIANGKYDTNNQGTSNAYNAVDSANKTYNNLYDYYLDNSSGMTSGEKSSALSYLNNANTNVNNAKSYYDQYLTLSDNSMNAKASQYNAQENAKKYVLNSLSQQGLGTQGVAESTKAGIANNYANNVASIDKTTMSNANDLYNTYLNSANTNKLQMEQTNLTNQQADKQEQANQKQELATEQSNAYNYASTLIENAASAGDSIEDIMSIYDSYKDKMSSDDLSVLKQQVEATGQSASQIEGDDFEKNYLYTLQSGNQLNDYQMIVVGDKNAYQYYNGEYYPVELTKALSNKNCLKVNTKDLMSQTLTKK